MTHRQCNILGGWWRGRCGPGQDGGLIRALHSTRSATQIMGPTHTHLHAMLFVVIEDSNWSRGFSEGNLSRATTSSGVDASHRRESRERKGAPTASSARTKRAEGAARQLTDWRGLPYSRAGSSRRLATEEGAAAVACTTAGLAAACSAVVGAVQGGVTGSVGGPACDRCVSCRCRQLRMGGPGRWLGAWKSSN